ncbi:MAG: hypothetical protein LBD93_08940 [Treponema sp.]|jgi:hypothetical protein|nr:hypothetical protein [Treponema sp.]
MKTLLRKAANWKPVIEPASQEEIVLIEEGMQEYREHPETFISLDEYRSKKNTDR